MARNMLRSGIESLAAAQERVAGEDVFYRRKSPGDGTASATIKAVIGNAEIDRKESQKTHVVRQERDFLIRASVLAAAFGSAMRPEPGDRIEQTIDGVTVAFEAAPRGDEPSARWSDEFQVRWRIHGQLVKTQ